MFPSYHDEKLISRSPAILLSAGESYRFAAAPMDNYPRVSLGPAAVSRSCFPKGLARKRGDEVASLRREKQIPISVIETVVETQGDVIAALGEIGDYGINALCILHDSYETMRRRNWRVRL